MADIIDYTQETIKQTQNDVLTGDLKKNDLMKPSPILPLNKSLKGTQQNVINAINEVLAKSNTTDSKFINFADFYNDILLDINTPNGHTKYNEMLTIGSTVIEAIINLNTKSTSKSICFQVFEVNDKTKLLQIQCLYGGKITKIIANTSEVGTVNSEFTIEKISENDFKNKLNNWSSILSSNVIIKANELVDDGTYVISNDLINSGDYYRINLIGTSDLKNINLEIKFDLT